MKHLNFRIYSLILACTCMVGCAEQFDEAGQADKAHMLGIAVLAEIGDSGRELPELAVTMTNPDENYTVQGTIKNVSRTICGYWRPILLWQQDLQENLKKLKSFLRLLKSRKTIVS